MSFNKLGSAALVAVASILVALFWGQKDVTVSRVAREMVSPTSDLESSDLLGPLDISGHNELCDLPSDSDGVVYFGPSSGKPLFPGGNEYCGPDPEPCEHSHIKKDPAWMKCVPPKCAVGYEEAGVYTTNKGVKIEENEFVKQALTHLGFYGEGSYAHRCKLFYFVKLRACVPEGSSCFPNGDFSIKTHVYYNLVAKDYGILGAYTGSGAEETWEKTIRGFSNSVKYFQGPFYPGQEYHFAHSKDVDKEHTQWRFEETSPDSNTYRLINRWTGQFMGTGPKNHQSGKVHDKIGKSRLDPRDAVLVTMDEKCDGDGTVTLRAQNNGSFKRGMTGHLFFTSNDPPPFSDRNTDCSYNPACLSGETNVGWNREGCWLRAWRITCRNANVKKPGLENKKPLKFYVREVTSYIEPQHSAAKGSKSVPINIDSEKSTNRVALESLAPKYAITLASNSFDAAMQHYFDNPQWQPLGRTVPKIKKFRSAGNAIIVAQRMRGTLGKPLTSVSSISRTLKFASLGGPAFAICTGFLTAYFDIKAAEATEQRFRVIEERLNDIVKYIKQSIEASSWKTATIAYQNLYERTYSKFQKEMANKRPDAFTDLDRTRVYGTQRGGTQGWIQSLQKMKFDFEEAHNLTLDFVGLENHMVADFYMYTYPTIVVSYIQLIEEIVSLKALLGTAPEHTCEEHVDREFGKVFKNIDQMKTDLKKLEKLVTDHRITETELKSRSKKTFVTEPVLCPPTYGSQALPPSISPPTNSNDVGTRSAPPSPQVGEIDLPPSSTPANDMLQITQSEESSNALDKDVSIQYCQPIFHDLVFKFKRVQEASWNSPLLEVQSHDTKMYERVLQLRRNEVKWTFKNFGKYSLDVLYDAIDNCKSNIIGTCKKLKNNQTYRNEFVEFGKQETLHAYDEEWKNCSEEDT